MIIAPVKRKGPPPSMATVIVAEKLGKKDESPSEDNMAKEGCMKASEELLAAIKAEDSQKVYEALASFMDCYEMMEEESEPEMEDEGSEEE